MLLLILLLVLLLLLILFSILPLILLLLLLIVLSAAKQHLSSSHVFHLRKSLYLIKYTNDELLDLILIEFKGNLPFPPIGSLIRLSAAVATSATAATVEQTLEEGRQSLENVDVGT